MDIHRLSKQVLKQQQIRQHVFVQQLPILQFNQQQIQLRSRIPIQLTKQLFKKLIQQLIQQVNQQLI